MKRALIIGYAGQDGTLLVEYLAQKGYQVFGIGRTSVLSDNPWLSDIIVDVTKKVDVDRIMQKFRPNEIYYLAACHTSSEGLQNRPAKHDLFLNSQAIHVTGLLHFLASMADSFTTAKLFYASSSMVFNGLKSEIQDETTPLEPQCIYGITKAQGMWLCREYREKHKVFASSGILYNHESYLRPPRFLSTKVIQSAIRIAAGSEEMVEVGNLSSRVDWGYAPDYVKAFHEILSLDVADDFIIATGEDHTVQEYIEITFAYFGLNWRKYIRTNKGILSRSTPRKIGNANKLHSWTGWQPSYSFSDFVVKLIEDHLEAQGLKN